MKTLTVKLNSETGKKTFYAASNFGQLVLTSSKKEAYNNMSLPLIAKIEVHSDSVFSTTKQMNKHYRSCAINALRKEGIIDEFENVI